METPPTWLRAWTGLHQKVKRLWTDEGIDDVQDLAGFYTTEGEINDHLLSAGVQKAALEMLAAQWRDAKRAVATAKPAVAPYESRVQVADARLRSVRPP
eukprot:8416824-Heterocapsa_arctica.AAC.1